MSHFIKAIGNSSASKQIEYSIIYKTKRQKFRRGIKLKLHIWSINRWYKKGNYQDLANGKKQK